jgi:hypothetical protein
MAPPETDWPSILYENCALPAEELPDEVELSGAVSFAADATLPPEQAAHKHDAPTIANNNMQRFIMFY